jgi:hypothetical protein
VVSGSIVTWTHGKCAGNDPRFGRRFLSIGSELGRRSGSRGLEIIHRQLPLVMIQSFELLAELSTRAAAQLGV